MSPIGLNEVFNFLLKIDAMSDNERLCKKLHLA